MRRPIYLLLASLLLAPLLLGSSLVQADRRPEAQATNQAGLVVVYGDGRVFQACVSFAEAELPGAELLRHGVGTHLVIGSVSPGIGEAICKVDNVGCTFPGEQCFCQCLGDPCIYWSYWNWKNGDWVYSGKGAGSRIVRNGDIDAWVWGDGNVKPPAPGEAACAASPTPTTTIAPPTATPSPSATETIAPPTSTFTPSIAPSATTAPSATETQPPTSESTATRTPTRTLTPTRTATRTRTATPEDYPGATETTSTYPGATETPPAPATSTPWPTWTAGPTITPQGTPTLELALGATSTATPDGTYPLLLDGQGSLVETVPAGTQAGPLAGQTPNSNETADLLSAAAAPLLASAGETAESAGGGAAPAASEATLQAPTTPTTDRVAMVLSTSIARSQVRATPAPARVRERVPRHQYGSFAAIFLFLLLLIGYAVQVRRQRGRSLG